MHKRETELDLLRLIAMLAVIWVHVDGMESGSLPTSDSNCQWLIFLKSLVTWQSVRIGAYTEAFTGYTNPNTIIVACAIYTLFTKRIRRVHLSEKACRLISKLSEYSFGVYLIHALILDIFETLGLRPTILHPVLSMPLITMCTLAAATILVILIRKIPVIGRKIT